MTVDLSLITSEGLKVISSRKLDEFDGGQLEMSFHGYFVLEKKGRFQLKGKISVYGSVMCARCLKNIDFRDEMEIFEVFSADEDDEDNWPVNSSLVNIDEALKANIYQIVPMKALCKDTCKGLCSICGKDLNEGECGCQKPKDPRFQVLSSFFEGEEV